MRNLSYSFTPDGSYFVFDLDTGETVKTDIRGVKTARAEWIRLRGL